MDDLKRLGPNFVDIGIQADEEQKILCNESNKPTPTIDHVQQHHRTTPQSTRSDKLVDLGKY